MGTNKLMAYKATFIGIDKYLDREIRDLAGARRDATALCTLFADSIAGCDPVLLVDDQATHERVEAAMTDVLYGAGPDDVAILFFAGHGTKDHRLVTHNTAKADLSGTTISMQRIADLFRASKARAVLCILDCCFSGAAPARVLDDSPVPRDPGDPIRDLAGEG